MCFRWYNKVPMTDTCGLSCFRSQHPLFGAHRPQRRVESMPGTATGLGFTLPIERGAWGSRVSCSAPKIQREQRGEMTDWDKKWQCVILLCNRVLPAMTRATDYSDLYNLDTESQLERRIVLNCSHHRVYQVGNNSQRKALTPHRSP